MQRLFVFTLIVIVYIAMVSGIIFSFLSYRDTVLGEMTTAEAREDWQQWRDKAEEQSSNDGPVQRKIPKSEEPPTLVLLRDYFGMSLTATLVFSSLIYVVIVFLFLGAVRSS